MQTLYRTLFFIFLVVTAQLGIAQSDMAKKEAQFYSIVDVPIPKDVVLEVGGMTLTDDDKLGVSTRRGEVWVIDKPYSKSPSYKRFASGMHEVLGLNYRDNSFYLAQRGELTKLEDKDNDGEADVYKTIYTWPLSGNYHDYSYGPKFMDNGDMLVTLNLSWIGHGASLVKWRGWMLKITPEGEMTPIATGLRSPSGFVINDAGDVFYSENQGDWVGSGRITHLEKGTFAGNPEGLVWTDDPKSPLKLKKDDIEEQSGLSLYEYAKKVPELRAPAIWLPHTILGISTSDMIYDTTKGNFGPFEGQMFVGDQGHSKIMRVYMEKVNGVYQGAVFPFVEGFSSGILRMLWGSDNSMFVGMTSRGWSSTGRKMFGLQRLVWNGKVPFEIKTIKAEDDGFLLEFTKPIDKKLGADLASYNVTTFNYLYHNTYGSPIVDQQKGEVTQVKVSDDGRSVKLTVKGMRLGFIHQLKLPDLKAKSGEKLLHDTGYYTLNEVPGGTLKSEPIETNAGKNGVKQPKRVNEMPLLWVNGPTEKIVISTKPGLKYDIEELKLKRRSRVAITFKNNDDMLHNLVITDRGEASVNEVGDKALHLGLDGADLNYVPDSELVLVHTGIVQPESEETIYFDVPNTAGEYWIVCTFPGHSASMRIKLIVE
ncbi:MULTISPECIES: sulfocyanin-like copper-binding protein [Zobellia]|uniref:Conserved azurin-containing protein n=1 Tax=Zobellia galactanivorans (strain DSM 12802 / CCUG 47099 / CIP 106680 / NCIMB 13871 / Dsij) TaxID=63186 RepID=G0KZV9_ZOBGA|nr:MULTISPECIES: sulfocyanin-like copper-binding protein [Zobellia]OWW23556.1 auracyanin family protein [Zobellia sp. OII3]CAZ97186.1 Conserved azurin-containing protein [Zobellia galactanivorans]